MTSLSRVLAASARSSTPAGEEAAEIGRIAEVLLAKTRRAARSRPEVEDVVLGGSLAKGTWLPGMADIDVFVRMKPGTKAAAFERAGLAIGAGATRGYPRGKKYAQHPYIEATVEGVRVNVVPCYAVEPPGWKSAADRSPFHVEVVKALPDAQKTQVRMLKRFMRAVGVYGAEIEVQGFSGYVAEVMIMKHGDLAGVLRHYAGAELPQKGEPLSLPDPVDPSRNLGVAVSAEKLGRFVLAAREFLSRPSPGFFSTMPARPREALKGSVVGVVFAHRRLSEDVLWGELKKSLRGLVRLADSRGFKVARSAAASDDATRSAFLIIPEFASLPTLEQRAGPTVDRPEETRSFVSANKSALLVWVDDDARVRLLQRRKFTSLPVFLREACSGKEGPFGASREVAEGLGRGARVLTGDALKSAARSRPWLQKGVEEITSDAIGTRGS